MAVFKQNDQREIVFPKDGDVDEDGNVIPSLADNDAFIYINSTTYPETEITYIYDSYGRGKWSAGALPDTLRVGKGYVLEYHEYLIDEGVSVRRVKGFSTLLNKTYGCELTHVFFFNDKEVQRGKSDTFLVPGPGEVRYYLEVLDPDTMRVHSGKISDVYVEPVPPLGVEPTEEELLEEKLKYLEEQDKVEEAIYQSLVELLDSIES